MFVFCRTGSYWQFYLLDADGEVVSRDLRRAIKAIACEPGEPIAKLPSGYNAAVMRVKERFEREVRERRAEIENRRSLKKGQRYVRRELQVLFAESGDGETRERINTLEGSSGPLIGAVERKLNQPSRQGARSDTKSA